MPRGNGTAFSPGMVHTGGVGELLKRFPIRKADKLLLLSTLALGAFGIIMVYSASRPVTSYFKYQLAFFFVGLFLMVVGASFDYHKIIPYARAIYIVAMVLMLAVFIFPKTGDAHIQISLWFINFQPSELAKLVVILALATFISDRRMDISSNVEFLKALAIALVPMFLMFLASDLGMAISVFVITIVMLMIGGARLRQIAVLIAGSIAVAFLVVQLRIISSERISRLLVFINPSTDQQKYGYGLNQLKIAIGSGQLTGKGLFNGTQGGLLFIPRLERHSDYIFGVVGEELGFIGGIILLALFAVLVWRGFKIAATAKDSFGTMVAIGIVTMIFFQIFLNIGMIMGLMPITGIPLPFISYGGTSLVINFFCIGLLLNIGIRRFSQA